MVTVCVMALAYKSSPSFVEIFSGLNGRYVRNNLQHIYIYIYIYIYISVCVCVCVERERGGERPPKLGSIFSFPVSG